MRKIVTFLLSVVLVFVTAGCTGGKKDEENVLIIEAMDAGYGVEWLYKLEEVFEAENEGIEVEITATKTMSLTVESKLLSGLKNNPTDLYVTSYQNWRNLVDMGSKAVSGYDCVLADLTDIYDMTIDGKKVFERLRGDFRDSAKHKDKYYAAPWASGPCGFMINKTVFDYYNWEIPETMAETVALLTQISQGRKAGAHDIYPLVYPGKNAESYWSYVYNTWACQYEGVKNYKDFWQGVDASGSYTDGYVVYAQKGREASIAALEQVLGNNDFIMPGSTTFTHTDAQAQLLSGAAAIIPTGDWFENEMSGSDFSCEKLPGNPATEIAYLPTPLLDEVAAWAAYENSSGIDEETGLQQSELYQRYLDAKNTAYSLGQIHASLVPAYANAREPAKDFIRLMISDRGCDIFLKYGGSPSPFKSEYTQAEREELELTDFQKAKLDFNKTAIYITSDFISPIRYKAALANYNKVQPEAAIVNGKNAADIVKEEFEYVKNRWTSTLTLAGLG
jgi:ABC-type glycerol-3-phosphate transport system substrate-binding protein